MASTWRCDARQAAPSSSQVCWLATSTSRSPPSTTSSPGLIAGADLRLVAQTEATTPLGVYARPGLSRLADLEGGRFAVDAAGNGFSLVARYLLEGQGVTVEYIEVGGVKERLDALLDGTVDATLLGPPFDATARDSSCPLLATVAASLPAFPGQGLVVRAALLGSGELAAYLHALRLAA